MPRPRGMNSDPNFIQRSYQVPRSVDAGIKERAEKEGRPGSMIVAEAAATYLAGAVRVPLVGHVRGGPPHLAEEHVEEWLVMPASVAREGDFALTVHGDSMAPALEEGDIAIVRPQPEVPLGSIAVASPKADPDQGIVKRYVKRDRVPLLCSDNPDYEEVWYPGEFEAIGRVIAILREL